MAKSGKGAPKGKTDGVESEGRGEDKYVDEEEYWDPDNEDLSLRKKAQELAEDDEDYPLEGAGHARKGPQAKRSLIDRIFPPKYDFHGMIRKQAEITAKAIEAFVDWLKTGATGPATDLNRLKREADEARWYMEGELIKAFATPFDRTDIYELSRQIDRIIDSASDTAKEMALFEIGPDAPIMDMAHHLSRSTRALSDAIQLLESEPRKAERLVPTMRKLHAAVEKAYQEAISYLLSGEVTMEKIKRKEVYHNYKSVMKNVGITVDIFHRIVVGLV